jgi:uncharacterized protein (DUF2236 family)
MTRNTALRPREDWGFFGPDSPTWKVWTGPTALLAFQRSIVVETFDPFLAAAVDQQNKVRYDPSSRFDRTIQYFLTVAVADSRTAIEASEILMRVHAKATGIEPLSGLPYSANDPDSQLWIHVTGWQSNLLMYERYGPGRLTPEEEERYWADCVIAAELQTCDPAKVPRSREDVRDYYATVRPRLAMSDHARDLIHYFLYTPFTLKAPGLWLGSHATATATIATIPRWMRKLGGFDQPAALDRAVVPIARAGVRVAARPWITRQVLRQMAPSALPVMKQLHSGEQPRTAETLTPAEAHARYGRASRPGEAAAAA